MYRTKCTMYDEVDVGNPGKVPYCAKQDKLEPDCQHCKQPCVTNADKIRTKTDKQLAEWLTFVESRILEKQPMLEREALESDWLEWLKEEVKDENHS